MRIGGSSSLRPLVADLATDFRKLRPDIDVRVQGGGTTSGIERLLEGSLDAAMASRPLRDHELEKAAALGVDLVSVAVASSGICVIAHRDNPIAELSFEQVADVFSGEALSWEQVGGLARPIQVVLRNAESHSKAVFAQRVMGNRSFSDRGIATRTRDEVLEAVASRSWAVGFTGIREALRATGRVRLVPLRDESAQTTLALEQPLHLWMTTEAPSTLRDFVDYLASDGAQQAILLAGFFSSQLPDEMPNSRSAHERLFNVLWVQRSAEFLAATQQLFQIAEERIGQALDDPSWSADPEGPPPSARPPAILVDVEGALLDESPFWAEVVRRNLGSSADLRHEWSSRGDARAVPGALEFVRAARAREVEVFYLSDRDSSLEGGLRKNLEELGFPLPPDRDVVFSHSDLGEAVGASAALALLRRTHRVILVVGDSLDAFVDRALPLEQQHAAAREHAVFWGKKWILLPNPNAGTWPDDLYLREDGLSDMKKLTMQREALQGFSH
ncbi:MAG: substrate-binding domain-containing protein [Thermoanaerobaculia bacterium]|nr:substrate-binding domain-containing protein [Thermoanaerobaculia bacterium]